MKGKLEDPSPELSSPGAASPADESPHPPSNARTDTITIAPIQAPRIPSRSVIIFHLPRLITARHTRWPTRFTGQQVTVEEAPTHGLGENRVIQGH